MVYVEAAGGFDSVALRRSDGLAAAATQVGNYSALPPVPDPGYSFTAVSGGRQRSFGILGTECSYVTFANGCAGTRRASRLIPRDTPVLGRTIEFNLLDLPTGAAIMLFGWSRTWAGSAPLPLRLDFLGMVGCSAHVSPDHSLLITGTANEATCRIPVPSDPAVLGTRFYNQAVVLDQGATPIGAVVSDAAAAIVGG